MSDLLMQKDAHISACETYRYRLRRWWGTGGLLPFVMLNPSTADAEMDDPTIRRCLGFARRENAAGIVVVNQFAFRATHPVDLWKAPDPHGPLNDAALREVSEEAARDKMPIVCAWGAHGGRSNRHIAILQQSGARLVCLGRTKDGHPRHPLYVKSAQPFENYP